MFKIIIFAILIKLQVEPVKLAILPQLQLLISGQTKWFHINPLIEKLSEYLSTNDTPWKICELLSLFLLLLLLLNSRKRYK